MRNEHFNNRVLPNHFPKWFDMGGPSHTLHILTHVIQFTKTICTKTAELKQELWQQLSASVKKL